jgi:hypothetical protein
MTYSLGLQFTGEAVMKEKTHIFIETECHANIKYTKAMIGYIHKNMKEIASTPNDLPS